MKAVLKTIELYYEKTGTGKPLILVHGNGEDHTIFDKIIPTLSQHYTVFAVDSRGHGKSSPCSRFEYEAMAQDFKELIDCLQMDKPLFYGFSDGGIIGLILASKWPNLLSAMVISGANVKPDGLTPYWINEFKQLYQKTQDDKIKMVLEQPNIDWKTLEAIRIPVLVTAGSDDMILEAHTRKIADAIPDSRLLILEDEDHLSYVVHSDKMVPILQDYFTSVQKD